MGVLTVRITGALVLRPGRLIILNENGTVKKFYEEIFVALSS